MNTVMSATAIPPKHGMAIGTMTSDPRPVEVRTQKEYVSGRWLDLVYLGRFNLIPQTGSRVCVFMNSPLRH